MWTLPGALWVCGLVQSITCFSSTIIRVGAWIFLSCMIINHFSADWPIGEIALFERSLVWSPWQPKHPVKTMCPFEVSLSRTPNLYPFIRSHCSLRESSRYKCQLNARTRSFKWSVSLCIGATVSAACMTIKHFLVDLKDKLEGKWGKKKGMNSDKDGEMGWVEKRARWWGQWDPRRWMEHLSYCSPAC